jgi:hypothetical protein
MNYRFHASAASVHGDTEALAAFAAACSNGDWQKRVSHESSKAGMVLERGVKTVSPLAAEHILGAKNREDPRVFCKRFSGCRNLLRSMAGKFLRNQGQVDEAVKNCFASASLNPPRFESESAFHCWLLRILIREALLTLHSQETVEAAKAR